MYLLYIDESGTSDISGNTSHFVLCGLSVPVWQWKNCDKEVAAIKAKYALGEAEIHVAWLLRPYNEQSRIPSFAALDHKQRRSMAEGVRKQELLRLQRSNVKQYKQTRKNFRITNDYVHLTFDERKQLIRDLAEGVSRWQFARVFAECVDKVYFDPQRARKSVDEQSFEQLVSRFELYLRNSAKNYPKSRYGMLVHDNNETVAKKHTKLMKEFHRTGTLWTGVENIVETPLFVDSSLTSMVQIADLCAYALRRYVENQEEELFDLIFQRADRKGRVAVGVRHFTGQNCRCRICAAHRQSV